MDPLAQLKDIQLPTPIHQYPIAVGWWLLLALIIIISIITIVSYKKRQQRLYIKKQALAQVQNSELPATEVLQLFKAVAIAYFSREIVAPLFEQKFLDFLTEQLPAKHQATFVQLATKGFTHAYQKSEQINTQELNQALQLWLTKVKPPKKLIIGGQA